MPTTTPIQGLPIPVNADAPNIPTHFEDLATNIENKLVMRFANASTRSVAIPAPVEGMMCVLTATKEYQIYSGGGWRTFFGFDQGAGSTRYAPVITYNTVSQRPSAASVGQGIIGYSRAIGQLEQVMYDGQWHAIGARKIGKYAHTTYGSGLRLQPTQSGGGETVTWHQETAAYINVRGIITGYADGSRFGSTNSLGHLYITAKVGPPSGGETPIGPTARELKLTTITAADMTVPFEGWFYAGEAGWYSAHIEAYQTGYVYATDYVMVENFFAVEPVMVAQEFA